MKKTAGTDKSTESPYHAQLADQVMNALDTGPEGIVAMAVLELEKRVMRQPGLLAR